MFPYLDMNRCPRGGHAAHPPLDYRDDGLIEGSEILAGQGGDNRFRMKTGFKQDFIRVGVADGVENGVGVEEDAYLLSRMLRGKITEPLLGELRRTDVGAEGGVPGDHGIGTGMYEVDLHHLLFVCEVQVRSVVEPERQTLMPQRMFLLLLMLNTAREHQIQNQLEGAPEGKAEKRSVNVNGRDRKILQGFFERITDVIAQDHGLTQGHMGDPAVEDVALEVPLYVEQIGKFGHRIVSGACPFRRRGIPFAFCS